MSLNYQIVTFAGNSTVSLFHEGQAYIASDKHPSYEKIVAGVKAGDASVVDLFDIAGTINRQFKRLSGRFTVENGRILLDGDPMENAFTRKVLAVLESDSDDWLPLVKFGENILQNPSEYSRSQLFDFLEHNDFAINQDGLIVAYKGVYDATGEVNGGKTHRSGRSGATPVSVNDGEAKTGYVYQSLGDTVSMARSLVDDNSGIHCSTGLHISNYEYALSYGQVQWVVLVHPANVVSVPNEAGFHKIRCCAYQSIAVADRQHTEPVIHTEPVSPVEEAPVVAESTLEVENQSAAAKAGLVPGRLVSLRNYVWANMDGEQVYDREYFINREIYLGSYGHVADNQRGAASTHNVKVEFSDGDWTVWVHPSSLRTV